MVTPRVVFEDLVLESASRLEPAIRRRRDEVEFAVEDVPPSDPAPWEEQVVPLGRLFPATGRLSHRIVLYRRPIESRAHDPRDLAAIVHEVVVEQVAALLGVPPSEIDPDRAD